MLEKGDIKLWRDERVSEFKYLYTQINDENDMYLETKTCLAARNYR